MDVQEHWRSYATICRLCLQKDGFMLGIFNHLQGRDKSIYKKIIDCTALQISYGDGLPNVICHRCLYKIEFCLEFRQLCFISDATLRQINGVSSTAPNNKDQVEPTELPLYEQLANGNDENVVMVVDPTVPDYESEYETENERQSDNETTTTETNNVTMCKYCDQAFTDKQECLDHETNGHNTQTPYNCTECQLDFTDRLQYSAHLKTVHQNEKPYNCPQCDRTFARRSDLRKHTIVHTGVKPFTCNVCFKSFSRNTNLSKHMRIHSSQKPFVCPKCPKTFTSKMELSRHITIHNVQKSLHKPVPKQFNCNFCNLSFSRRDKLLRHEKRHFPQQDNTVEKPVSVEAELQILRENLTIGDYNYASTANSNEQPAEEEEKQEMVINLDPFNHNIENGDATPPKLIEETDNGKKFNCNSCNKSFSSPENLKYHQACHTGVRPYCCSVCCKSFIRKRELDRHMATHTGQKPFKCPKCNKGFGRKDKLVRHVRIHDVQKEHNCESCGATFNRRDTLLQHLKTHSTNLKEEDDQPQQQEQQI